MANPHLITEDKEIVSVDPGSVPQQADFGDLIDNSGNGHLGALVNYADVNLSRSSDIPGLFSFGESLICDGVNDVVTTATQPATGFPLTMAAFLKPTAHLSSGNFCVNRAATIFRDAGSGSCIGMGADVNGNAAMFTRSGSGAQTVASTTPLPIGVWSHLAVVDTGAGQLIYLNGAEVHTASLVNGTTPGTGGVLIGQDDPVSSTRRYNGLIKDLRIYNATLTPDEILSLASGGALGTIPATAAAAFWAMNVSGTWTIQCPPTPFDGQTFSIHPTTFSGIPVTIDGNGEDLYDPAIDQLALSLALSFHANAVTVGFNENLISPGVGAWVIVSGAERLGLAADEISADLLIADAPGETILAAFLTRSSGVELLVGTFAYDWVHPGTGNRLLDVDMWIEINGVRQPLDYELAITLTESWSDTFQLVLPSFLGNGILVEMLCQNIGDGVLTARAGSGIRAMFI